MKGFNFPNIFKGNAVEIIDGKESARTQLGLLIKSEVGEFKDDPGYGSNLPLLQYKPDGALTRDLIKDSIYDLQMFCPNLRYVRNSIQIEKHLPGVLKITVPMIIDTDQHLTTVSLFTEVE